MVPVRRPAGPPHVYGGTERFFVSHFTYRTPYGNQDYALSTAHGVNRAQNPADLSCGPFCLFWVQASSVM
jgi:hypothetical protein